MLRNKISFSNLLIPVAFAAIVFSFFYSAGQFHAGQIQTPAPAEPQNENREVNLTNLSFEYGMLIQDTENNTYQFMIGDQLIPQNAPTRLDNMIRLLGGKQIRRPNFGSLLNTIGAQGWELFDRNSNDSRTTWMFKRAY